MKDKIKLFQEKYDVKFMLFLFIPPLIFSMIISPFFPDPHLGVYIVNYLLGIVLIVLGGGIIAASKF